MIASVLFSLVFVAVLAALLSPALRQSTGWQATVTPLASIIGSGFLVSAPLLARTVGNVALLAMAGLIAAAYLLGHAIRFNIAHAEPLLKRDHPPRALAWVEQGSRVALAFAYFVSVAYYLTLLASFVLKGLGHPDPMLARGLTTAVLLSIGAVGAIRGLHEVEKIEVITVSTNLAVIAGLLVTLAWHNGVLVVGGTWHAGAPPPPPSIHAALVVLGLLIVVQGFETSRFLGDEFDAETRIRTMRRAQMISAAIYVIFFALVTVLFSNQLHSEGVAAIIDMTAPVAPILPLMLTLGAVASQFSAAVADSIGAAGLIEEVSARRITLKRAYVAVAAVALAVVWLTDVFGIINLASRAFALFYAAQCGVAVLTAHAMPDLSHRAARMTLFTALGCLSMAVVIFAIPSGG